MKTNTLNTQPLESRLGLFNGNWSVFIDAVVINNDEFPWLCHKSPWGNGNMHVKVFWIWVASLPHVQSHPCPLLVYRFHWHVRSWLAFVWKSTLIRVYPISIWNQEACAQSLTCAKCNNTSAPSPLDIGYNSIQWPFQYSYGPLPVISTYNPIYRMYNPIYNQL